MATDRFTTDLGPERPHLVQPGGGISGEVYDLRQDMQVALTRVAEENDANVATASADTAAAAATAAAETAAVAASVEALEAETEQAVTFSPRMAEAMSGDMLLAVFGSNPETVLASELNAAAAGTFKRTLRVDLENASGDLHEWLSGLEPVLTPGYTAAATGTGDVPVVTGTPAFAGGSVLVEITFATDAGATLSYEADDTVTVDVQISATDALLGHTVTQVTKTYLVA